MTACGLEEAARLFQLAGASASVLRPSGTSAAAGSLLLRVHVITSYSIHYTKVYEYWTLRESVELRHAPFALWITDLSVKDPFYVLPLLV